MNTSQHDPPGLDLARLADWFTASVPGAGPDLTARLVAGGRSNLTYEVSDGTATWIVRRPPLGHVLATAHDMAREFRVMSALRDTGVPVPATYALCDDESVVGAPFYVMERVAGTPYRHEAELQQLGQTRILAISTRLVDTLTTLHAIDPVSVGLGDFGHPEGFLGRQVRRWKKQLDASHSRDLPAAETLSTRLTAQIPTESAPGIVHGDYRVDNVLFDDGDAPVAVLDWEMATLGDPLTDLALLLVYRRLHELGCAVVADSSSADGFLDVAGIVDRYAGGSDRDLSRLGFYLGLAAFKLAAILEGIHYRYLHSQTVGPGFEDIGDAVAPLLETGLTSLKEQY